MEILGYTLVITCGAYPEQYTVFDQDDKPVGYFRLRWGDFRADYTCCGGETVYRYSFDDDWKCTFDDDEEQEFFLTEAVKALHNRINSTTKEI